jgi:iron-sulfur cluster repair protein YtfE (RIC family)
MPGIATHLHDDDLDDDREAMMNDPIAMLRKDHREAEGLLKRLEESSSPGPRRRETVEKLRQALTLHMEIEERVVYPVVVETLGQEPATEADVEHDLARAGLAKMVELVEEPGFGASVDMVKAGIKHHVKEEETEIFPKLKKRLGRETLRELGDRIAAMKADGQASKAA